MKKIIPVRIASILIIAISLASCSKKELPQPVQTVITSIFPTTVRSGDTLHVFGKNLLKNSSIPLVLVNGHPATLTLTTQDSIKAIVPAKAGSGSVQLKIGSDTVAGPSVTYEYKATVTTIAGNGSTGRDDGPGSEASFNCPWGIAADANGNLFVADCYNRLIRKITVDNIVSTYQIPVLVNGKNFFSPYNIAIDTTTQNVYVTDFNQHLMKMDASGNMDVIYIDEMPLTGVAVNPSATNLFISNNTKGTIVRTDMNGENPMLFTQGLITPRNIVFNKQGQMFVAAYPGPIYEITNSGAARSAALKLTLVVGRWQPIRQETFFLQTM
jgi:hypothetical protein